MGKGGELRLRAGIGSAYISLRYLRTEQVASLPGDVLLLEDGPAYAPFLFGIEEVKVGINKTVDLRR